MSSLIMTTELALIGLLGFLAVRLLFLYRSQPVHPSTVVAGPGMLTSATARTDEEALGSMLAPGAPAFRDQKLTLITQLHILYSLQERDARQRGLDLLASPEAVQGYIAAWVYGAACALVKVQARHTAVMVQQVAGLVARKLAVREMDMLDAINGLASCSTRLACFRCGLEGAEHWQKQRFVPGEYGLYQAITAHTFI